MKTAMWLYLFMFLAFFDLHAQYPILTPFAMSLGAGPAFIGWMMGMYSLTHLPGNLLAGVLVDRNGSRRYIVFALTVAGLILLLQAHAQLPWHLLLLRAASGFALAFLSPACMTLLASLSSDPATQGKYMSGNGIIHTLASVVSPAAGAFIVAKAGYSGTFSTLGWLLIFTGVMAFFSVPKHNPALVLHKPALPVKENLQPGLAATTQPTVSRRYYLLPFFVSCSQGVLFFELPLSQGQDGMVSTGILLSLLSLGALATLCLFFLNRISPGIRIAAALLGMALCFFTLAAFRSIPAGVVLFLLGSAKGIIPGYGLTLHRPGRRRTAGPDLLAAIHRHVPRGLCRTCSRRTAKGVCLPYFIAFVLLMTALLLLPPGRSGRLSSYAPDWNSPAA